MNDEILYNCLPYPGMSMEHLPWHKQITLFITGIICSPSNITLKHLWVVVPSSWHPAHRKTMARDWAEIVSGSEWLATNKYYTPAKIMTFFLHQSITFTDAHIYDSAKHMKSLFIWCNNIVENADKLEYSINSLHTLSNHNKD